MAKARFNDEIVAVGRKRVLDLRAAISVSPSKPAPSVPHYKTQMTDVFRYGLEVKDEKLDQLDLPTPVNQVKATPDPVKRTSPRSMSLGRRIFTIGQYPVIGIIAIASAYSSTVGQWLILAFAIYALLRRLDSRYSFGSAIFLLITIPLFQVIGQSGIAQNAAIYVFELLVIGTIQAVWELRKVGETAN